MLQAFGPYFKAQAAIPSMGLARASNAESGSPPSECQENRIAQRRRDAEKTAGMRENEVGEQVPEAETGEGKVVRAAHAQGV